MRGGFSVYLAVIAWAGVFLAQSVQSSAEEGDASASPQEQPGSGAAVKRVLTYEFQYPAQDEIWYAAPQVPEFNQDAEANTPFQLNVANFDLMKGDVVVELYAYSAIWNKVIAKQTVTQEEIRSSQGSYNGTFAVPVNKLPNKSRNATQQQYLMRLHNKAGWGWRKVLAQSNKFHIVRLLGQHVKQADRVVHWISVRQLEEAPESLEVRVAWNKQELRQSKRGVSLTLRRAMDGSELMRSSLDKHRSAFEFRRPRVRQTCYVEIGLSIPDKKHRLRFWKASAPQPDEIIFRSGLFDIKKYPARVREQTLDDGGNGDDGENEEGGDNEEGDDNEEDDDNDDDDNDDDDNDDDDRQERLRKTPHPDTWITDQTLDQGQVYPTRKQWWS